MGQTLMVIPCSISLFVETEHIKIMILMFKSMYMLIILVIYRCACIEHEKNIDWLIKLQTTECKYTKLHAHTQS